MADLKNQTFDAENHLIDHTYDVIAEPSRFEDFMAAWELYLDEHLNQPDPEVASTLSNGPLHANFTRGMAIFNQMNRRNAPEETTQSLVDSMSGPTFILSRTGHIKAQNVDAQKLDHDLDIKTDQSAKTTLLIDINGWIKARLTNASDHYFTSYTSKSSGQKSSFLAIGIDRKTFEEEAASLDIEYYLVTSVDLALTNDTQSIMKNAFDLGDAEVEVAISILNGLSPSDIAAQRKVSLNTIRTQIRGLLSKTETRGLPDLSRFLTSFAVKYGAIKSHNGFRDLSDAQSQLKRESSVTLPDGRNMAYLDMGDPNGRPVLFFHSIICGVDLTEHAIESCYQEGIRIIAPSLPGYGNSSPNLKKFKEELLEANAEDCAFLLDSLDIQSVLAMGHIVGSVCAQAFAYFNSLRCDGVICVGHGTHFDKKFFENMGVVHRVMGKTILHTPTALPFIVRASVGLIDTNDEDRFIRATHNPSDFDKRALERPDIRDVVVKGIKQGVAQGGDAFCQYSQISMMSWLHHARHLEMPVTLIQGEKDELITEKYFPPYFEARPDAQLVRFAEGGKYMLYTHWPQILGIVQEMDQRPH